MSDLDERLARLGSAPTADPTDTDVHADLQRGFAALRRRRMRRAASGAAGVVGVLAIASLAYVGTSSDPSHGPPIADPTTRPPTTSTRTTSPAPTHQTPSDIRLVAYEGKQLPGFRVRKVPDGYVLQGVAGAVLDIAKVDDHSSLYSFVGKLVVSIELKSELGKLPGRPVKVKNHHGVIRTDSTGVTTLEYVLGKRVVDVQSWSNIGLSDKQLIEFAKGITVTRNARLSHG